jgi:hypothetical protein
MPLQRCVVINAAFFDAAAPVAAVEGVFGDEFTTRDVDIAAAVAALQRALDACPDGGTIALRGRFELLAAPNTHGRAVRLLAMPAPDADAATPEAQQQQQQQPELHERVLAELQAAAARALGRPGATLQLHIYQAEGLRVRSPLWLEGIHVQTGDYYECGKVGWPHRCSDEGLEGGPICDGVSLRANGGGASPLAATPLVARRCWLTAHSGSGVVLDSSAHAALLRCCVSDCLGAAVACNSGAVLRMRGCHVVFNNADITAGAEARRRDAPALALSNVFHENWPTPGCIDAFPFPTERTHFQYPDHQSAIAPQHELAPWSPMFTVGAVTNFLQPPTQPDGTTPWHPPPVVFPRVRDVALLAD